MTGGDGLKQAVRERYTGPEDRPRSPDTDFRQWWPRLTIALIWALVVDAGVSLVESYLAPMVVGVFPAWQNGADIVAWVVVAALLSLGAEFVPVLRGAVVAGVRPFSREMRWWRLWVAVGLIVSTQFIGLVAPATAAILFLTALVLVSVIAVVALAASSSGWRCVATALVWGAAVVAAVAWALGLPLRYAPGLVNVSWWPPAAALIWVSAVTLLSLAVELVPILSKVAVVGVHPFGRETRWWRLSGALGLIIVFYVALFLLGSLAFSMIVE